MIIVYQNYYDTIKERDKQLFEFIINDCQLLKDLIDGLLNYSKISHQELVLDRIDPMKVIDSVVDELLPEIQERKALVDILEKLPHIMGKEDLIKRLIYNLMDNALKFHEKGESPRIEISAQSLGDGYVEFKVSDNGIGIQERYREEVFKIFKKLHPHHIYKGNGIGLASSKKIVKSLGGHIWFESKFGSGSNFYFTLKKYTV